jgi:predicted DNA-binding protein YlxM (UPF0122 family)/ribosomal protein S8
MNQIYYDRFIIFLRELSEVYNIAEKKILFLKDYYGIDISQSLSLQEIGNKNKISKERVRQSIEDVKKYCRDYINDLGSWFKGDLEKLNKIIHRNLPAEKERLVYDLFKETHCARWVLHQEELFGVDSQLSFSKMTGTTFVFSKGYQSIKLSTFKKKQALKHGYDIKNDKIVNLSKLKDKDIKFLYKQDFIEEINLSPLLISMLRKEVIKNGTLHIDRFLETKWKKIEEISTISNISKKNKIYFINDIINMDDDFTLLEGKWIYSKNLGRNVMIRNIYKLLSLYEHMPLCKIKKILLIKTDIEYLPPNNVLKKILNNQEHLDIVGSLVKSNNIDANKYITKNEKILISKMREQGGDRISLSSYEPLWAVANQSILFYKTIDGDFSLFI